MEQDRKEKAPARAEVGAPAVRGKERVVAKVTAEDKAVVVARAKEKVKPKVKVAAKHKAADRISEFFEKGA